jgi:isoquinoline 1-oxidoreductase alpha subunit
MIRLTINGKRRTLDVDPDMPLLWALRDHAGLTGTKYSCGIAVCGACTVHVEGAAVRACVTPIKDVAGKRVTTIEALDTPIGRALKAAWEKHDVVQCGFCQSGQLMSAAALLASNRRPSDAQIDQALARNLCRCATYNRIRAAIHDAAGSLG